MDMKFLLLILGATVCSGVTRQSLNGKWTVTGTDVPTIIDASVPGGIFSDLMNGGVIGDVFYGTADTNYSWVGFSQWNYATTFTVDENLLAHREVHIVFEGVDTFATILINGIEVGITENMFVRYVMDIKEQLQIGSNNISVIFTSAVEKAAALAEDPSNEYVILPECPAEAQNGLCHVNRIRKMQAAFSWDWGPAFASVGIWKDVYLEAFDDGVIDYVLVTPVKNPDREVWTLVITTYFNAGGADVISGKLNITLQLANEVYNESVGVEQYLNEYYEILETTTMEVPGNLIDLWWPNGYGTQSLYNLSVTFIGENEQDEKTVRVGFRTVELVQDELEDQGLSFYFKINGNPIFAKGANEIPINILPEMGQDRKAVRNVLQTAKDTHMNMLRVWGGGVYESDYFYDLADEYGILIWQDFMFACAMYPSDEAYLNNVITETRHQLKRLASHPSIAIWAGNNENEAVLSLYAGLDNFTLYKADYVTLFVDVIESEVRRILSDPIFVTSSPSNGLESDQVGHLAQNPGDSLYGDVHFYDYLSDSWDISTFPTPRFASEYGYQSMPSVESWLTATDSVDDFNSQSTFLKYRQHHPDGNQQNLELINLQLQLPNPSSTNYTKAFIYFSQILQAQSIKLETEHYRSFKGRIGDKGQGYTMGALYWQLNDVWVAPTWSGMDYLGRWKMLQYQAQEFFNPMIVTGRLANEDLEIYAIVDGPIIPEPINEVKGLVHIYKWGSLEPLVSVEFPVQLDRTKSVLVTTINASTAFKSAGCGDDYAVAKTECFFHLHLVDQDNNHLVPFNYVFPDKLKNCNLADPKLEIVSITAADEDSKVFEIVVTTDAVALFVWLDSHEIRGRFSENGFLHVLPTKTVYFIADEPTTVDDLAEILTITHLRDPMYL